MKKELIKLAGLAGFLLVWGVAVPYYFPTQHLELTWLIVPLVVVALIKFSTNAYRDMFYSFALLFLNDRLDIMFSSGDMDSIARATLLLSFYVTTLIVFIIWTVALFTVFRKRLQIKPKKIFRNHFLYLAIMTVVSLCFYTFVRTISA